MAGYQHPKFCSWVFIDHVYTHKHANKRRRPIPRHLNLRLAANKKILFWKIEHYSPAGHRGESRGDNIAPSWIRSQFILPSHGPSYIVRIKDVRAHCYCAYLVRALFIDHARATSFSSACTESESQQNIELMTYVG